MMATLFTRTGSRALGAAFLLAIAGCGGKGSETDNGVVIADPAAPVSNPTGSTGTPAKTASDSAAAKPDTTPASGGVAAPVKSEGWGTLKGRVVFDGTAPPRAVKVPKGDPNAKDSAVCATSEIKSERLIVDEATKGLKNVIVFIPKPTAVNPEAKSAKVSTPVLFDQKKCVFEPHVVALMTGTKVELKSSDAVGHNVHSKVTNNDFNEAVAPNGVATKSIVAASRQPGLVVCDIHPWMEAYWLVLDNPYFAVTDDKGNFEIKNAPAGTQKVAVWQEATGFVTPPAGQDVTIAPSGETTKDYTVPASKVRPE
jgi:plastocyanin